MMSPDSDRHAPHASQNKTCDSGDEKKDLCGMAKAIPQTFTEYQSYVAQQRTVCNEEGYKVKILECCRRLCFPMLIKLSLQTLFTETCLQTRRIFNII